ncbi:hypothetical protein C8J57DRAFT_1329637 [Mycena rebaudengoi]|nr:hypothetical protein C8J57DRAFT_1386860 [Mycena rebaudengoi]KAJ7266241.1 hypothetical protein C8J57DRAFT_1329637 [Mycena rebaudengoi]
MRTLTTLLVGFLATFAIASPSRKWVFAPGNRAATNIYEIPAGGSLARVGSRIHVLAANGTVIHVATAGAPTAGQFKFPVSRAAPVDGWVAFAYFLNPGFSVISSFTSTWEVPPLPETDHGQTIYLFNAVQNFSNTILQPVLQYGPSPAGGGPFWAVASFFLDGVNLFHTPLVRKSPGETLNGALTLRSFSSSESVFNYTSQFSNIPGTTLNMSVPAQLNVAAVTLEAYNITAFSDYPAGTTVFSGVNVKFASGETKPDVVWRPVVQADGLESTVDQDGAVDAQITVKY